MKHRIPGIVAILLLVSGCNRHDPDPFPEPQPPVVPDTMAMVHFTLNPVWAGASFDKTVIYTNVSDHRVQVQQLKLYLGDLQLAGAGDPRTMKDIDLFDITNGPVERYYPMAAGTYEEFHFGIGVPEDLNHTDPVLYPNEHPLSGLNGMFWTWASLYRFLIFDGRYDTLPGPGALPYQFSIHTGLDTCYRKVEIPGSFVLSATDTIELVLDIDIDRFFHNATDTFKLNQTPQWHGEAADLETGLRFSDLVSGSMSIQ